MSYRQCLYAHTYIYSVTLVSQTDTQRKKKKRKKKKRKKGKKKEKKEKKKKKKKALLETRHSIEDERKRGKKVGNNQKCKNPFEWKNVFLVVRAP